MTKSFYKQIVDASYELWDRNAHAAWALTNYWEATIHEINEVVASNAFPRRVPEHHIEMLQWWRAALGSDACNSPKPKRNSA